MYIYIYVNARLCLFHKYIFLPCVLSYFKSFSPVPSNHWSPYKHPRIGCPSALLNLRNHRLNHWKLCHWNGWSCKDVRNWCASGLVLGDTKTKLSCGLLLLLLVVVVVVVVVAVGCCCCCGCGCCGWLVGWLVGGSVGRSVGRWVGWLVGRSVGRSVGRWVGWLVGWLVGCCPVTNMGVNECSNINRYVVSKNAASQKGQFLSPVAGFVPVPNKGVIAPSMIRMSILLRQAILIHIVGVFFRPTQGVIPTQYDEELLFLHWFGVRSRTLRLHPENPFLDVFFSHQSPSHGSMNQSSGDLWQSLPTQGPLAVEAFQPPRFTKWRTDRGDLEDPRIR